MWEEQWNKQPDFLGSLGPTPPSLLGSTLFPKQETYFHPRIKQLRGDLGDCMSKGREQ